MTRKFTWIVVCLILSQFRMAAALSFRQPDFWTFSFEDLSDFFRKCPGMYPMDYGTLGSPLLFRPWQMNPWNFQVSRDGIPQNRTYDGLFDSNLQPATELEKIDYDFLSGEPAGQFQFSTRNIPVDTPYTEFLIREGYYGLGTVDFAHAQRAYKSLSLQVTGRLAWYNGLRDFSATRTNRLQGIVGFDLGDLWRSELTYGGSNDDGDFFQSGKGYYSERSDGILSIALKDSVFAAFRPSLKLFSRQDREKWGSSFRARELTSGWVITAQYKMRHQAFNIRHLGAVSTINFPGMNQQQELSFDISADDSLDLGFVHTKLLGGIRRESGWSGTTEGDLAILPRAVAMVETNPILSIALHGGMEYTEQSVPVTWRRGSYLLSDRPLLVDPAFSDIERTFVAGATSAGDIDRYLNSSIGFKWRKQKAFIDVQMLAIHRPGDFGNKFVSDGNEIQVSYERFDDNNTQLGFAAAGVVPLWAGLRIDSWWFFQTDANDIATATDWRGYSRLYFERQFFTSPLTIRSHISYEEIGRRQAFSDRGIAVLGPSRLVGFRASATIRGVTLIWGVDNFFKEHYAILPGYNMIAKEEYVSFIWRLWL